MKSNITDMVEVKLKTGIDHLRDIHLYEKVKRKILWFLFGGVTALTIILAFEVGQLYAVKSDLRQAQAQAKSMELKYGNKLMDCVTADKKISVLTNQVQCATQSCKDAKKEAYYNNLTCAIVGWYSVCGEKKSPEEYKEIRTIVGITFDCSARLFKLKYVKCYASNIRECAIRELSSVRKESNFNLYPKPYVNTNHTKDYGPFQVNEVNLDFCFSEMRKLGVWSPKDDVWAEDPKTNAMMRIIVDESRTKSGKDKINDGHWDKSMLNLLQRVQGYEGVDF